MPRGGGAANGAAMASMPYTPQVTHSGDSEFEFDHTLYMRIPHTSAGAVIGHDGVTVRKIISDSGAHVFIAKVHFYSKFYIFHLAFYPMELSYRVYCDFIELNCCSTSYTIL